MRKLAWAVAACSLVLSAPLGAEDRYPDTEYISGKAGFNQKIKGVLVIDESAVKFLQKNGATVFEVPLETVVSASVSKEKDEGSFGRKAALGIFASKTEEFLQVETKTADTAEALVFKTKKKMSPGMATKINFYVEKRTKQQ